MSQMFPKLSPSVFPNANHSQAVQTPSAASVAVNRLKVLTQPDSLRFLTGDTVHFQGSNPTATVSFGRELSQRQQHDGNAPTNGISALRVIAKTGLVMAATVLGGLVGGPWVALGAGLALAT